MIRRDSSRRVSFSFRDFELETPGSPNMDSGIELADMRGNVQNSILYEEPDLNSSNHRTSPSLSVEVINNRFPQQAQQPVSRKNVDYMENTPRSHRSPYRLSLVEEFSESEDSEQLYGRPNKPAPTSVQIQRSTPGEANTLGVREGEVSSQEEPTLLEYDLQDFMDWDEDIDNIGDCYFIWKHKKCFFLCFVFLLLLIFACLLFAPRPLHLCINFTFDDENVIYKGFGDEGNFDLKITNPNYIPVSLHGFEINAYYRGVADVKEVISVERSDYSIGALKTFNINNETYFFAQNSTDVVPVAALDSCSAGYRTDLTYDLVTTFEGCLSFMCKSGIILKSSYVNHCLEEDGWMCTEFDILG